MRKERVFRNENGYYVREWYDEWGNVYRTVEAAPRRTRRDVNVPIWDILRENDRKVEAITPKEETPTQESMITNLIGVKLF